VAPHRTLLIVDPQHAAPQRLSLLLQSRCNILTSDSANEALEIAKDLHPDVIVVDAALADENDYDFCRQLARSPKTAAIPLLLLSDQDCESRPVVELGCNICGCLTKPLKEELLLQNIQGLLESH